MEGVGKSDVRKSESPTGKVAISMAFTSVLLLSSCFTVKEKQKDTQNYEAKSNASETKQTQTNMNTKTNTIITMQGSTEQKYYIEIEPIGPFEFSPQSGFKGQASSIKLWGKRQSHTTTKDSSISNTALAKQSTKEHHQETKTHSNQTSKTTNKKTPSVNWLWLIPLAALALLLRQKA